jgi:hypothetical protein
MTAQALRSQGLGTPRGTTGAGFGTPGVLMGGRGAGATRGAGRGLMRGGRGATEGGDTCGIRCAEAGGISISQSGSPTSVAPKTCSAFILCLLVAAAEWTRAPWGVSARNRILLDRR